MTKKRSIIIACVTMISVMILIIGHLFTSSGKQSTQNSDNAAMRNDNTDELEDQITDDITEGINEEMEAEYMQLFVWKAGTGSELLDSNKVFLFKDYSNDEYRTMVAAASYGRSSAGEYIIVEYYEADRGMLGYMVRIRDVAE